MALASVTIDIDTTTAAALPEEPAERQRVVELGLQEWRLRQALESCRRGEITLARAAELAAVPLRQMIPLAYAHGLTPAFPADRSTAEPLTLEEAASL